MIFRALPDVEISWGDVWVGAFVTSLLFAIGKYALAFYLGRSAVSSTYGAAGSLVLLLLWAYYSAQILFFGVELTRIYAHKFGTHIKVSDNAVPLTDAAKAEQGIPEPETVKRSVAAAAVGGGMVSNRPSTARSIPTKTGPASEPAPQAEDRTEAPRPDGAIEAPRPHITVERGAAREDGKMEDKAAATRAASSGSGSPGRDSTKADEERRKALLKAAQAAAKRAHEEEKREALQVAAHAPLSFDGHSEPLSAAVPTGQDVRRHRIAVAAGLVAGLALSIRRPGK